MGTGKLKSAFPTYSFVQINASFPLWCIEQLNKSRNVKEMLCMKIKAACVRWISAFFELIPDTPFIFLTI